MVKTLFVNVLHKKKQQQHVITFDRWKHYLLIFNKKKKKKHVITFDRIAILSSLHSLLETSQRSLKSITSHAYICDSVKLRTISYPLPLGLQKPLFDKTADWTLKALCILNFMTPFIGLESVNSENVPL